MSVCRSRRHFVMAAAGAVANVDSLAAAFQDPLLTPAQAAPRAAQSLLTAITPAGDHWVAVGRRGHVLVSDASGTAWRQADVPLSADLVAVHFPTPRYGWAVGHDGVILHSSDGGWQWRKQADGRSLAATMLAHYERRASEGHDDAKALAEQARRWVADGPIHPLFSVWFADARNGYVGGAFGLLFRTRDGGQHWEPWLDRIDNPKGLHLYGLHGAGGEALAAGEQGLLAVLDDSGERFRSLKSPYEGSFFGVVTRSRGHGPTWLLHGMRGNAFASDDRGAGWHKLALPSRGGVTAGAYGAAGELMLTTQIGECLVSKDEGASFARLKVAAPMPYFGLAPLDRQRVALVGPAGVRVESLP